MSRTRASKLKGGIEVVSKIRVPCPRVAFRKPSPAVPLLPSFRTFIWCTCCDDLKSLCIWLCTTNRKNICDTPPNAQRHATIMQDELQLLKLPLCPSNYRNFLRNPVTHQNIIRPKIDSRRSTKYHNVLELKSIPKLTETSQELGTILGIIYTSNWKFLRDRRSTMNIAFHAISAPIELTEAKSCKDTTFRARA